MNKSNLILRSNVYLRKGHLFEDRKFATKVQGRLALEKLMKLTQIKESQLTPIQRKVLIEELKKCYYNEDGDITFGLKNKDGIIKWVCRCEKFSCKNFTHCRSDMSLEDIDNLKVKFNDEVETSINEQIEADETFKMKPTLVSKASKETSIKVLNVEKLSDNENDTIIKSNVEIQENIIKPTDKKIRCTDPNKIDNIIDLTGYYGDKEEKNDTQKNVIQSPHDRKIHVNAGPGTGKTYTLIKRVEQLITGENPIDEQDMIILSFSRAAITEINKRFKELREQENTDLNYVDIRTFDSFATYIIKEIAPEIDLIGKSYDDRIEIAIDVIENNPKIFELTKHIIIDEIQDLVGVRARFVKTILKHTNCGFTILGDQCQAIYDYQVKNKNTEPNSEDFINWIYNSYSDLYSFEFDINYRQKKYLEEVGEDIRESILVHKNKLQEKSITAAIGKFDYLGECQKIRSSLVDINLGKTCFLCRTNGHALKVSKYLRDQGIINTIQRLSTFKILDRWLGEIFNELGKKIISYDEFETVFNEEYTNKSCNSNEVWIILKEIEDKRSSKLDIEELIINLNYKKQSYSQLCIENEADITISTIHRSKGREYDTILLLDNYEAYFRRRDIEIEKEIKVFYVAVTRAKKNIFTTRFKHDVYMQTVNNEDSRWIETKFWFGKKKINKIEIGKENDIIETSFIDEDILEGYSANYIQAYILNNVKRNDSVKLKKRMEQHSIYYDIYHNGNIIGRMSKVFVDSITKAYRKIYKVPSINPTYLPDEISEVYIDNICTYVKSDEGYNLPNLYKKTGVWNGVTLIGLGKLVWYKDN